MEIKNNKKNERNIIQLSSNHIIYYIDLLQMGLNSKLTKNRTKTKDKEKWERKGKNPTKPRTRPKFS